MPNVMRAFYFKPSRKICQNANRSWSIRWIRLWALPV